MSDSTIPLPSTQAHVGRRGLLKGLAGMAGLAALDPVLSACSSSGSPGGGGSANSITFGSNYSDPAPKQAFAALVAAATKKTGVKISVNTVDHNTFQNNISSYLQGTPNDLFTWFAGYRMQFFAAQGLATPIDDVWEKIGGNFNTAAKALSKGLDGKYYFIPIYNYPWVVFYNKSTFKQKGYTIPATWDDFIALAKLMKHQIPWTDKGVTAVFNQWLELMPYLQSGANGRIWEDAAKTLEKKQAGMMFQGTNQVAAQYVSDKASLDDLDFFPYPAINPAFGQDYMDAPTDGFMLAAKAKNPDAAKRVLEYIGGAPAEAAYLKFDEWDVGLAEGLSVPSYNSIQTKSVQAISACKSVSQFMDRDTDPAMATAMISLIQKFVDNPTTSTISTIQKSAEAQAKTIFTS